MNLRQTAEVSAIIATSASHVIENPRPVPIASLHGYWKQSRTRLKCWFAGLHAARPSSPTESASPHGQTQLVSLSREILVTEMLTRIWATVLTAADRHQQADHAHATAQNSYQGHLEARHEVLRLMAEDATLPSKDQASLDRFRRRVERWTDALIGPLLAHYDIGEYVFDVSRAREFAGSSLQQTLNGTAKVYTPLLVAGVTAAFARESDADRERALLNLAIVRSILSAFPQGTFPGHDQVTTTGPDVAQSGLCQPKASGNGPHDILGTPRHSRSHGLSFLEIRRREGRDNSAPD